MNFGRVPGSALSRSKGAGKYLWRTRPGRRSFARGFFQGFSQSLAHVDFAFCCFPHVTLLLKRQRISKRRAPEAVLSKMHHTEVPSPSGLASLRRFARGQPLQRQQSE